MYWITQVYQSHDQLFHIPHSQSQEKKCLGS